MWPWEQQNVWKCNRQRISDIISFILHSVLFFVSVLFYVIFFFILFLLVSSFFLNPFSVSVPFLLFFVSLLVGCCCFLNQFMLSFTFLISFSLFFLCAFYFLNLYESFAPFFNFLISFLPFPFCLFLPFSFFYSCYFSLSLSLFLSLSLSLSIALNSINLIIFFDWILLFNVLFNVPLELNTQLRRFFFLKLLKYLVGILSCKLREKENCLGRKKSHLQATYRILNKSTLYV